MVKLLIATALFLSLASYSSVAKNVGQTDFDNYKDNIQLKIDSAKELVAKDRAAIDLRLDAQDKRIGDLSVSLTIFGILISVVLGALAIVGYLTVTRRTRDEASAAAKAWFEEKGIEKQVQRWRTQGTAHLDALRLDVSKLIQAAGLSIENIRTYESDAKVIVDQLQVSINLQQDKKDFENFSESSISVDASRSTEKINSEAQYDSLAEAIESLRKKPESEYTFDDWNTRAFYSYRSKELSDSVYFWSQAIKTAEVSKLKRAKAINNIANSLRLLTRYKESQEMYQGLLNQYSEDEDDAIQMAVARALHGKAVALAGQGMHQTVLEVLNEFLIKYGSKFNQDGWEALVQNVMLNRAVALGKLDQRKDAIAQLQELEVRFKDVPLPSIVAGVGKSLVYRGKFSQDENLPEFSAIFDEAIARYKNNPNAAWGDFYAQACIGRAQGHLRDKNYEAGLALYESLLSDTPKGISNTSIIFSQLGKSAICMILEKIDESEKLVDTLIAQLETDVSESQNYLLALAYAQKTALHGHRGEFDSALDTCDRAIELGATHEATQAMVKSMKTMRSKIETQRSQLN